MKQYLELVEEVLENGEEKIDRTGVGTISLFGTQKRYDLRNGFPLVTTKKVRFKNIVAELLWFLSGETNIHAPLDRLGGKSLHEITKIWDAWADEKGNLGPIYGKQWVSWEACHCDVTGACSTKKINQVAQALEMIKENPTSRRIIVSSWNVGEIEKMALPPCHSFFQLCVSGNRLDMQLYQRSADVALGVPYNIASYALLLSMMAQECNLEPGVFVHTTGDTHIYTNHIEGLQTQITRTPHELPRLVLAKKPFWDITIDDIAIEEYTHDETISFPIAV